MPSLDIVSRTDLNEIDYAVQGASREISTRYDFKASNCSIEQSDETLVIKADDDFKLKQVQELLRGYQPIQAFWWTSGLRRSEDRTGRARRPIGLGRRFQGYLNVLVGSGRQDANLGGYNVGSPLTTERPYSI